MRLLAWMSAVCVVAGSPVVGAAAPADGQVLVVPPGLRGVVGAPAEASLGEALRVGMARAELPVLAGAGEAAGCEDDACRVAAGARAGAAYVVRLEVDAVDRDYNVRVALIDVASGDARRLADGCTICGLDDAVRLVESLGARLGPEWQAAREEAAARRTLEQSLQAQPRLRVTSRPAGAAVFVDGEKVGVTPTEHRVTAGRHVVEVRREHYVGERREVELVRGATGEIAVDLRAAGKLPPTARSRAVTISGAVLLGVGGVGLGLMGVGLGRGAALEREGEDLAAKLEADGVGGLELTDALADTRARGARANTLAVVGGAVGGALVVTGAVLVALGTTNRMRRVAVAPWGGRGLAGLVFAGRF